MKAVVGEGDETAMIAGLLVATAGEGIVVPAAVVVSPMAPATLESALFVSDTTDANAAADVLAAVVEFPKGESI